MKKVYFKFKELIVRQKALEFADQVIQITENLNTDRKHFRLIEQLESSSTSIAQDISEGKGRYSKKECVQYLYISRASFDETVTLLNLFQRRNWISIELLEQLEEKAFEIANMIKGLINSINNK